MSQTPAPWSRQALLEWCATDPERVVDLVLTLWKQMDGLTQQLAQVTARLHELERQVNQNSRNSSKPPSSDGPKHPAPQSLRGKSGQASGGQPGHPGSRLEMQENPDHVVVHRPTQCAPCAHPLDAPGGLAAERRQVFDLVARREVTEHQVATVRCPACAGAPPAAFPSPVPAPVQ